MKALNERNLKAEIKKAGGAPVVLTVPDQETNLIAMRLCLNGYKPFEPVEAAVSGVAVHLDLDAEGWTVVRAGE